jgi:hypothetical protein
VPSFANVRANSQAAVAGKRRKIKVVVARPQVKVQARAWYVYEPSDKE